MGSEDTRERSVARLISRTADLKHRRAHELLDELGFYQGQAFVLYALWDEDGLTQSELTERLQRSPSTITKTVQRLEKAGFVKRCSDDADERVSRVYLTNAGRDIRPTVEEIWNKLDQQIFQGFNPQEVEQLGDYMTRVYQNLNKS